MLVLHRHVRDEMFAHALQGLPHEACGVFAADAGSLEVHTFFPMANAAASSEIYQLDNAEWMAVERKADEAGWGIVGVMHSHTHTTAYPSPTDVADAGAFAAAAAACAVETTEIFPPDANHEAIAARAAGTTSRFL